ncbi:hypothetical protein UY3_13378 [Chelonia mydas]|uniref:Uncharacterized protein n=1 Tax=Chelonia mydas TaxID=8469 RepID=M7AXL6_CHEMY|nr:hypothetical protein UY3_13378 [Chelonia mydas]
MEGKALLGKADTFFKNVPPEKNVDGRFLTSCGCSEVLRDDLNSAVPIEVGAKAPFDVNGSGVKPMLHSLGKIPSCVHAIPRQAWSPLSSLSPYVSWMLADVVLHCYTAAATHCLVAADGAIGLKTIVIVSEVLLATSLPDCVHLVPNEVCG